ncbi:MAG TPA: MurT ligase domain-containing protein, partial [Clostridia bacterium]|nr:MurT ligase domain-containing protein [Clostridia bacterium]
KIKKGIETLKKTKLILNADDSLCSSLGKNSSLGKLYYGFDKSLNFDASVSSSDAAYCIYCKTKYVYTNRIYGHLGGYSCPNCHYSSPKADVICSAVIEASDKYSLVGLSTSLTSDKKEARNYVMKLNVPGIYNIYNSMSAITCGFAMELPLENSVKALERFENSFGRMENIRISNLNINIILVKNPTGFNQVLEFLSSYPDVNQLALLINDNAADGRDISWLWDVEFEKISGHQDRFEKIYVSGTRAEDMALRLKYAGFDTKRIELVKDYNKIIDSAISNDYSKKSFCILPTYTALLEIRRVLQKKIRLKEIWK